jgi:uncharacterized protein (DUF4415 family)
MRYTWDPNKDRKNRGFMWSTMKTKGTSSRRGARKSTKRSATGRKSVSKHGTDWGRLMAMPEEEIHAAALSDPDAQPTTPEFWRNARVVYPKGKRPVTLRLDADLLSWFRQKRGYQTEINAVLRAYMAAHRGKRGAATRRRAGRRFGAAAE